MQRQLDLLDERDADWRLDEETKTVGMRGVAEAREALRRARSAAAAAAADRSGDAHPQPHAA